MNEAYIYNNDVMHDANPARDSSGLNHYNTIRTSSNSESPSHDESPENIFPPNITINYSGVFGDQLQWSGTSFTKFVEKSDMRSRIVIQSSNVRNSPNTVILGDTMALKDVESLYRLIPIRTALDDVTVDSNLSNGTSSITIHDQELVKKMMKKTNGKVDRDVFVDLLNNTVGDGLEEALRTEKIYQAKVASSLDLQLAGLLSALIVFSGGTGYAMQEAYDDFRNGNMNEEIGPIREILIVGISALLSSGIIELTKLAKPNFSNQTSDNIYFRTQRDVMDPLTHTYRLARGKAFLRGRYNKLVTPQL